MSNDNNYDEIFEDVYNKIDKLDKIDEMDENLVERDKKKAAKHKDKKAAAAGLDELKEAVSSVEAFIDETRASLNLDDIKEKLEDISLQVDGCNKTVLTDLYSDINSLKELTDKVGKNIEDLQNAQNTALTSAEFDEYQKQQLDLALKTNENIIKEIEKIQENSKTINNQIESLQNVQNLALTSAEFSDYQKRQLDLALKTNDNIFKELKDLKAVSENANSANIDNLKEQLESLHKSLKEYIKQITDKIGETPNLDDISSIISDLSSVHQKSIKQTNTLIKDLQSNFDKFEKDFQNKDFEKQIIKISEIYDSLNMINAWIEKVGYINQSIENVYSRLGENIDFDDLAEKVDIVYDNISALNDWTKKVDNIDGTVSEVQSKLSTLNVCIENTRNIANTLNTVKEFIDNTFSPEIDLEDISNKIDIVYENLSSINEWANKADNISTDISKLSASFEEGEIAGTIKNISEKVSNIDDAISNEMVASKIDLIYENIGLLNEWVSKIDGIAHKSEELDLKYTKANDGLNIKIDEMAETLANASKIIQDVPNMKDKLEELSGELHAITCTTTKDDTESYIYTLLDIESDFLKLHKVLDDNAKITTQDINSLKECFAELTDDISSISIRTNKLILSADDANKEFKTCLDEFRTVIGELEEKQKTYNPEHKYIILESKMHSMIMLLQKSIITSKNLNSAFTYLAEWIDATGVIFNNIQNDISAVKEEQKKEPKVPYATFDDMKVLAEGLDNVNENIYGLNKNISELQNNSMVMLKSTDSLLSLKDNVNNIDAKVDNISGIIPSLENIEKNVQQTLNLEQKIDNIANIIPSVNDIEENSKSISTIEQKLDDIANTIPSAKDVEENSKSISSLEQKINNFVNVISSAIDDEENSKAVSNIEEKLDNISNLLTNAIKDERNSKSILNLEQKLDNITNIIKKEIEDEKNSKSLSSIEQKLDNITSLIPNEEDKEKNRQILSNVENKVNSISEIIPNIKNIDNNFEQVRLIEQKIDKFRNVIPYVKHIAENAQIAAGVKKTMDDLSQDIVEVKELNPVVVEMALELKNNTLQVEEFKKGIIGLSNNISKLEDAYDQYKTDNNSELKSMITGVMVQLNTALTPEIDTLNEKIDKITEENGNKFTELETLMKDKIEIQAKQINVLEEKIENLSGKFDKLIEAMSENNINFEIKDVLGYIAAQVSAANEAIKNQSESKETIQKVADKLTSFDTNINKIVSYIEEE